MFGYVSFCYEWIADRLEIRCFTGIPCTNREILPCFPKAEKNCAILDTSEVGLFNMGDCADGRVGIVCSAETITRKPLNEIALVCIAPTIERLHRFNNPLTTITGPLHIFDDCIAS